MGVRGRKGGVVHVGEVDMFPPHQSRDEGEQGPAETVSPGLRVV